MEKKKEKSIILPSLLNPTSTSEEPPSNTGDTSTKHRRSLQNKNRALAPKNLIQNAKVERHDKAVQKYKHYEDLNRNKDLVEEMMKGEKKEVYVPKAGEYVVVTADKKVDRTRVLDIPIMDLLDGTKSFTELKEKHIDSTFQRLPSPSGGGVRMIQTAGGKSRIGMTSPQEDFQWAQENIMEMGSEGEGGEGFEDEFSTHLTRNLKTLTKRQAQGSLLPSNVVLSNIVGERVTTDVEVQNRSRMTGRITSAHQKMTTVPERRIQSSQGVRFGRPESANFVAQKLVGSLTDTEQNIQEEIKKYQDKNQARPETGKSKTSYQVKSKHSGRPKHITGYNTIKETEIDYRKPIIEPPKEKPIISPFMTGSESTTSIRAEKKKRDEGKPGYFLPLEYYFFDEEDERTIPPAKLIEKYQDPEKGKTFAYSKWFYPDGKFIWSKAEVLGYDGQYDRYNIKWLHNKTEKKVSRVNLRFENESEQEFQEKITNAETYRQHSETFLKYNYLIDSMQSPTHHLTEEVKDRVLNFVLGHPFKLGPLRDPIEFLTVPAHIRFNSKYYLIPKLLDIPPKTIVERFKKKNYNLDLLNSLVEEIGKEFIRANHQIEFDATLPYSEERQKLFRGIIEEDMFIPLKQKGTPETDNKGLLQIPYEFPKKYQHLILTMRKKLHQAVPQKVKLLLNLNNDLVRYENTLLIHTKFPQTNGIELLDYIKLEQETLNNFLRDFKGRMFDTYYEISEMVEEELANMRRRNEERARTIALETERRLAEEKELPPDVALSLKSYQSLVNTLFERSVRGTFERSLIKLVEQFEFVVNYFNKHIVEEDKKLDKKNIEAGTFDYEALYKFQNLAEYERPYEVAPHISTLLMADDEGCFELFPSPNEISKKMKEYIDYIKDNLMTVECLRAKEIGPARNSGYLDIILKDDAFFAEYSTRFLDVSDLLLEIPRAFMAKLKTFKSLVNIQKDKVKSKLRKLDFEEFKRKLAKLKANQQELERILYKDVLKAGLVLINVKNVKERLVKNVALLLQIYYKTLIYKIGQENTQLKKEVDGILLTLKKEPQNLEELNELRQYASDLGKYVESTIRVKINEIMAKLNLLEDMRYEISYEDFASSWSSYGLPKRVEYKADKCLRRLVQMEKKFSEDLMEQQSQLLLEIQEIRLQLDIMMKEGNYNKYDQMSNDFAQLGDRIEKTQLEVEVVNRRESLLKWKINDYTEIEKIKKEWNPYNRVWNLAIEYHIRVMDVLNGPIFSVDRDAITTEIIESWNELFKLEKQTFKLVPHMLQVTQTVRLLYEEFKPNLPIINDLRNPALKPRHWAKIAEVTGIEFDQESNVLSLKTLLDHGIMNYKDQINDISEIASKEQSFERMLNRMKNDWKNIKFELVEFRNTETYILRQLEPILDKLDEDLTKTMSIASSPFIKFLENDVNNWKNTLVKAQDIIDIWVKVQKLWQYLQPIFFSEDILVQMPKAGVKYQQADKIWRGIMENVFKYPNVLETCGTAKIRDNFGLALDLLEEVIKGLNDYLNKKRQAFPRFYFLSNDELLSILAQTREPKAVQKHLSKCFEGIEYLTFEEDLTITAMNSIENETVPFPKSINPLDKDLVPRNVEEWLADVEKAMKSSLRDVFHKALMAYKDELRKKWLFEWPSQMIVLCDQALWTNKVEAAIENTKNDLKSVQKAFDEQNRLLLEVVELLKLDISKKDRITLGVLIVIEVHAKDVIEELVKNEVKSVQAFEWLAQMRYMYEPDKHSMNVLMVNTVRKYGYEYLGNQARLVITPLTDRCYRTLMSALQMNLGGAPEGPAGTGKTETTKDLAKALAKHCVVFNCSEALDYLAMGKFFKGLCSCGSWACFDEFNRIELEVLSVIAQQILTIQNALIRSSKSFQFEDTMIPLDASCAVFITMNPGYAGRSELPDNLKALFRPVAMMIPNYSMIAEISLYSYGFTDARALSIKITTSLKLSSEQLSSQSHYDFGMRAVKSIILAAGALKRAHPNDPNEAMLVLRAIKECNVPKFTTSDVPLFNAILSDLFPKAMLEEIDYGYLGKGIEETCKEKSYSLTPKFHVKIMELYETIQVRHGLMVVGATMSGKSSIIKVLAHAIERASHLEKVEQLKTDGQTEEEIASQKLDTKKVKIFTLNPKSVTIQMLYGASDPASNEWRDGITANIFRECKDDSTDNLKWITFDGPVDALWIENMNTVLDDNKKLCLMNGETIKLTDVMSIVFEVEDLLEASPATVSRCGMVFMESSHLEWTSLYNRWKENLPATHMNAEFEKVYNDLNKYILTPIINLFQSGKMKLLVNVYITWVIGMFLRALEAYIFKDKTRVDLYREIELEDQKHLAKLAALKLEGKEVPKQSESDIKPIGAKEKTEIFACYLSALIWAFSSIIDESSKGEFEKVLREASNTACEESGILIEVGKEGKIPVEQSIYEQYYDYEKKSWKAWLGHLTEFKLPEDIKFHEVYIPTMENLRNTSFLYQMLTHEYPVLFVGKTGTGKTTCIKKLLLNELDQSKFIPTITVFSANTTCVNAQDVLESKLEKQKRRKGIYGPVVGFTNIIYIDDLNMPAKERYGAQPPLELIRQWLDYGGWYDRKSLEYKTIADIQFVAAMGVGRAPVSNRLLRHFNVVYLNEMSDETLKMIVRKTLEWGFSKHVDKVKFMINGATNIIFKTYKHVQTSKDFLPLPSKSHYIFNMRDMLKVVQGILSVPFSKYEATGDNKSKILRLLIHESICVYSDRLVNPEDKELFMNVLKEKVNTEYSTDIDTLLSETHLHYGNFMEMHAQEKDYQEIEDKERLIGTLEEYIAEYNSVSKSNKINIYLFDEAIALLMKINRIIANPFGNALLIGLGGSGRHTMSRLAAYMQDYILNEIEMEKELTPLEWYEFLKKMMKTVGQENKQVVFLVSDSQIRDDRYFEDINSLLNIGEIPNLFTADEKEAIIADLKESISKEQKEGKEKRNLSPLAVWEIFVNNCKRNLHIVLAVSPIGEKLRIRLRNFPSLVSCTSLVWILPWSEAALSAVATSFLKENANIELTEEQKVSVANICVEFHSSVNEASNRFKAELGRYFYVTPISYMQLLQNLERLLISKQQSSLGLIKKYENGIMKLEQCTEVVETTKLELEDLKPKLNAKEKETEEIIKDIEIETVEAEKTKVVVQADEEETSKKAASAGELQAQCQEKLSEALPGLEEAIRALKTLKPEDFVEMKATLNKPPLPIRKTMEAVCIMLGKFAKDSDSYMVEAKKQVNEPKKLMERLEKYDRDNIAEKVTDKLGQFLKENPNFKPEFVEKASIAAKGLCLWVLAMYKYNLVNKSIQPLKEDLRRANEILQEASDELAKKRAALREIEDKILALKMKFEQANLEKQTLKAQKFECELKLERAFQLTSGLGSERERWGLEAERLRRELVNLLGDILLAVGSISYLGAFTGKFRNQIIEEKWIPKIKQESIICSDGFSLQNTIGDPIEIQDWILNGLPLDSVSVDNAIFMKESTLWPLIIDPQKQATKFIKNKETKERDTLFFVTKPSDNIARTLEHVVRMGGTLLIENVGETIDPLLDPVLQKATYISGGVKFINISNQPVEYNNDFRLYLVSNLNNPHYLPEVLTKVTLLNFTITYEGLKDQMLSLVAKEEEPKDEDEKIKLMYETSADKAKKKALEDKILELLATSEGKILENEILIKSLTESKSTSEEIEIRLKHAKITEDKINANRANYEPVAIRASHLYLTILQLSNLDPMYQYSLEWFIKNYLRTMKITEKPPGRNVKLRVKNLLESLCKQIYREVTRSLFEKHKILFAFLMASTILRIDNALDQNEWTFLLTGLSGQPLQEVPNPDPTYFTEATWETILHASNLTAFSELAKEISGNLEEWKEYSNDIENKKAPVPYTTIEPIRTLVLVKLLRPDLFVAQTRTFVKDVLGEFFITPNVFTLEDSFKESTTPLMPLVFILSPGDDPLEELRQFAQEKARVLVPLSLGKGQGDFAAKQIKEGMAQGTWVLLQNCHLAASWMRSLEDIVENLPREAHAKRLNESFRLWLTTASSDVFPASLLQTSIKMTKDPPRGIKSNLVQIYNGISGSKAEKDFFYSCQKQEEWRKLFLSLGFFHAVIRERKRYGAVGWNIQYDFNMSDFKISMKQLHHMLNSYQEVPFQALIYLTGECYYGGRVTDDWDRRTLITLLRDFYNPYASEGNYAFSSVQEFKVPQEDMDIPNALIFSEELPNNEPPELFGLHSNAEITSNLNEANMILTSILQISPKTGGQGSGDLNKKIVAQAEEFLHLLPADFDIEYTSKKHPNNYYESMNTVLLQELARYNALLNTIRNSLKQLIQAMGGFIVMSSELESMAENLTKNIIPQIWAKRSYPSLKPLSGYFKDLLQRLKVLQDWIDKGQPIVFWLSGFSFPQSFLTGVLQNYARAKTIPIDQLRFDFEVLKEGETVDKAPETGCYISGLFLEGATWDSERGVLEESLYKVLYKAMPIIRFIPTEEAKDYNKVSDIYTCPVYKTSDRRGTLSTTGHSTNFILPIYLKSEKPKEWWIKRGVAMITQLNE